MRRLLGVWWQMARALPRPLWLLTALYVVLGLVDVTLSLIALGTGTTWHELNPLMRTVYATLGPWAMFTLKAVLVLLVAGSMAPLYGHHTKIPLARPVTWGLVVFMVAVQAGAALTSELAPQ